MLKRFVRAAQSVQIADATVIFVFCILGNVILEQMAREIGLFLPCGTYISLLFSSPINVFGERQKL
jgi:hypothetical protein